MRSHVSSLALCLVVATIMGCARTAFAEAAVCDSDGPAALSAKVRTIREHIAAAMGLPEADVATRLDVSAAASADIDTLKDALVGAADAQMACERSSAPDVKALQDSLASTVGVKKPPKQTTGDSASTGLIVRTQWVGGTPPWLLVRFGFPLGCGDDNLLLAYAYRGTGWKRVLRWQSGDYSKISGAWGDFFDYAVLPSDDRQERRLVVAHGTPWCTSRWSGFAMDVIEPGPDPESARHVFQMSSPYSRFGKPVLKSLPHGFEIRLQVSTWGAVGLIRTGIFRYREKVDGYERVQPVASNPVDFVDAWLNVQWPLASRWSEPGSRDALRIAHRDAYADFRKTGDLYPDRSVVGCPAGRYQVMFRLNPQRPLEVPSTHFFVIHADANDRFTMLSSGAKPDPTCNRLVPMKPH